MAFLYPQSSSPEMSIVSQNKSVWERLRPWMPFIFVIITFFCWGCRSLWDPTEARYGQAASEMLHTHNWLTPTLSGIPHLTKPPLSYWLMALGMKIFGINPWGARFFLSCSFLATIFTVQYLGKAMGFETRKAQAAAFIYATSALPFAGGHTLSTDGFLVFWETLGILAAWQVWQGEERRVVFWRLLFWIAFGLAFLTKGPPGCLPFLVIAVFLFLRRKSRRPAGSPFGGGARLFSGLGLLLFLLFSLSWYGVIIWQHNDLMGYFLNDEVYKRIFTAEHHRNAPFWIYLPILVAGVGPWMILWPWMIRRWWQFRPGTEGGMEDWQLFCLLWLALPLFIFMISKSRLVFYILPLFVPIALFLGHECVDKLDFYLSERPRWRKGGVIIAVIWMLAMATYTAGMDMVIHAPTLRPTALLFQEALALENQGRYQLYWLWAGRQRYSLAFAMGQIIRTTETFLFQNTTFSYPPIYITEEKTLALVEQNGWHHFGGPPRILARSQGLVLFTMNETVSLPPFLSSSLSLSLVPDTIQSDL